VSQEIELRCGKSWAFLEVLGSPERLEVREMEATFLVFWFGEIE
jgi:hypothetical protein